MTDIFSPMFIFILSWFAISNFGIRDQIKHIEQGYYDEFLDLNLTIVSIFIFLVNLEFPLVLVYYMIKELLKGR